MCLHGNCSRQKHTLAKCSAPTGLVRCNTPKWPACMWNVSFTTISWFSAIIWLIHLLYVSSIMAFSLEMLYEVICLRYGNPCVGPTMTNQKKKKYCNELNVFRLLLSGWQVVGCIGGVPTASTYSNRDSINP